MKLFGSLAAMLLAFAAAAALAPVAGAAGTATDQFPSGQEAEFDVSGTNGFKVHFSISKRYVDAVAAKGTAIVSYKVHAGQAEDGRFAGALPGIGHVSVRFRQRGKTKRIAILCPKAPTLIHPGVFLGTIRLRGEQGYTVVHATRAVGAVSETPRHNCGGSGKRRQSALMLALRPMKPQFLSIEAKASNIAFLSGQIINAEKLELSILGASHSRRRDGMLVENAVVEFGSAPAILLTEDLEFPKTATVQPPRPFSGSAGFELHDPHSSSWTGDLAVDLPGIGGVRLAGRRFRSRLCVAKHCGGSLPPEPGSHYVKATG
jgi:hypothetical protein